MMSLFPIIHDHKDDAAGADRHCFALSNGGWIAKVMRPAGGSWQVHIAGFRGFDAALGGAKQQ
jgi:hypothetical protein